VLVLAELALLLVFCPLPAPEFFPVAVAPAAATDLLALAVFAGVLAEADADVTALDVELFALGVDAVEPDDDPVEPAEPEAGLPSCVTEN
jgi:hypothetical protein